MNYKGMRVEDIIRITKECGGTMAGPDHPIYKEGHSFIFSSRMSKQQSKDKDIEPPLTKREKALARKMLKEGFLDD